MAEETNQRPAVGPVTRLLEKRQRQPQFNHYPDFLSSRFTLCYSGDYYFAWLTG